ncbi:MAG: hypothetical protein JOZ81_03645 [Chloroflexi bacterium]|nr:hypothetical protein [Chloroflexota bacterium]
MTRLGRAPIQLLFIWIVGLAVPVATAGASLLIARTLAPNLYGQVAYFFSNFYTINLLWNFGLPAQATREVASAQERGSVPAASTAAAPYVIARVVSAGTLALVCVGAVALSDPIMAIAAGAAAIASLATFVQALLQGLGRASLVAVLQLGQAVAYLGIIAAWGKTAPEHVFAAVIVSYLSSLALAVWASRGLLPRLDAYWALSRGSWRNVGRSLGRMYGILLLQTPYSSFAILALGRAGRFEDAAIFSIALTVPLMLVVASGAVIAVQYYPRMCRLLSGGDSGTRAHFDSFYRVLVWVCISTATLLLVYPNGFISVLFTSTYLASTQPVAVLAGATIFAPIGQFALWTLIAHGQTRWVVLGLLVQLATLAAFVALTIYAADNPLSVLAAGHVVAAGSALVTWMIGLKRTSSLYDWRVLRVAGAAGVAFGSAAAVRLVLPDGLLSGIQGFSTLAVIGLLAAAVTAPVLWAGELHAGSLLKAFR